MPIVFVHGVNVRESAAYKAGTLTTEAFFHKHLAGAVIDGKALPTKPSVWFPYWGDLATTFAWNMASLPQGEMQALGSAGDLTLEPLAAHIRDALDGPIGDEPLVQLAKEDFGAAVDLLVFLALERTEEGDEAATAAFVLEASTYADAHPAPDWVAALETDSQFLSKLQRELDTSDGIQSMGGLGGLFSKIRRGSSRLKAAVLKLAERLTDNAGDLLSTKLLAASRTSLNATLGRFFGDVFVYLHERGDAQHPGAIPKRILATFDEARAASPDDEPLIVVGHSLGGVVTFDLLSHFRPDLQVDLFVSVGSQVAHFEEMKRFRSSDKSIKHPDKAPRPDNIRRWINIYDEVDVFAYTAERVFDGVDIDARYDTGTYVIKAHGAYFKQNRFYTRLRARIDELA
ncbi:MAG: hypothetical protein AAFN13_07500 [Bacteroidota bacterium]